MNRSLKISSEGIEISKRAFWRVVSRSQKEDFNIRESFMIATQETGVAVAKEVKQPARRGTKFIEIKIIPKIEKDFFKTIDSLIDRKIK